MLTSLEPFISVQKEVNVHKERKKPTKTGQLLCCIKHAILVISSQTLQNNIFYTSDENLLKKSVSLPEEIHSRHLFLVAKLELFGMLCYQNLIRIILDSH